MKKGKSINYIKIIALISIALVLLSFNIKTSNAIGIRPSSKEIKYLPLEEQKVTITVINNEQKEMDIKLDIPEKYKDEITISPNTLHLLKNEKEKSFNVYIKLKEDYPFGENQIKIKASENKIIENESISSSPVNIKLEVVSKIKFNVEYPDTYLDGSMNIYYDNSSKIFSEIILNNMGNNNLEINIQSKIKDNGNTIKLKDYNNNPVIIRKKESTTIKQDFDISSLDYGTYEIFSEIIYYNDNNSIENKETKKLFLAKEFNVGENKVQISDFTEYFQKDKINTLKIDIYNKWNKDIIGAKATINIEGFKESKTFTYDIKAEEKQILTSYWDTKNIPLGEYSAEVIIDDSINVTKKEGKIKVVENIDSIDNKVIIDEDLAFIIAIIILLNIFFIAYLIDKKSNSNLQKKKHTTKKISKKNKNKR